MKKYLKDLEAELKKFKISKEEIAEILADHKEMLTEATNEGLTDEELVEKFGDPERIAKALYEDVFEERVSKKTDVVYGTDKLEEYELVNSFNVLENLTDVAIALVSEDVIYFPYDGESIEVYVKGRFNPEDYEISFNDGLFTLKNTKQSKGFNFFGRKTPDFGVRVPKTDLATFKLNIVSGDAELADVNAGMIEWRSVSGDIEAKSIKTASNLVISVVSGDAEIKSLQAVGLAISMVSGDLELKQGMIDESLDINTVSGDVEVKDLKVSDIDFHSVSGDFDGVEVYCNTVALKSVSGDLEIRNQNKDHKIEVVKKKSLSGKVTIK